MAWIEREGHSASALTADIVDEAACAELIAQVGELDGLVLNVGSGRGRDLDGTSPRDWDLTFAINLRGHFL